MARPLPYPAVIGAVTTSGEICVEVTHNPKSRSKKGVSTLTLLGKGPGRLLRSLPAHKVWWASDNLFNAPILAEGLRQVLNLKVEVPFNRGLVAPQMLNNTLYLYEAGYRGALYPRYKWTLPYFMDWVAALSWAIQREILSPDALVAKKDTRLAVSVTNEGSIP